MMRDSVQKASAPTPRQQGVHAACRVVTQSAIMAIQERGQEAAIDLVHTEIATMVRLLTAGQVEEYNDRLDGFCDTLGGHLYQSFLEPD